MYGAHERDRPHASSLIDSMVVSESRYLDENGNYVNDINDNNQGLQTAIRKIKLDWDEEGNVR